MRRRRVGILISGRGSNMAALAKAALAPEFPAEISLVISNRPEAEGLQTACSIGLAAETVDHRDYDTREAFGAALAQRLLHRQIDLVCLAGFMRILDRPFVEEWQGRLLNIHPSLLPAFKGMRVHEQALAAGVAVTGATVHFVVPELDAGPIIGQAVVPILPGDTAPMLSERVLAREHELYPRCLALVASERARLEAGHARFSAGGPVLLLP